MELFCGVGGLAVGFTKACEDLGIAVSSEAAIDQDAGALAVYRANHHTGRISTDSVSTFVDYQVRGIRDAARFLYEPELVKPGWTDLRGKIDVLLAGPPCQGHSNLNNHTRRVDRRNDLYLTVPAVAVALMAPIVIIENVPSVVRDSIGVVAATTSLLTHAGYHVTTATLDASKLGWPQRRSRFFLIARRDIAPLPLEGVGRALSREPRSVLWAIEDLADSTCDDPMMQSAQLSVENRRRVDWLFDNDAFDLPLAERPECHQGGTTYTAVYGRLLPSAPAPTITTGFMSPGRGRFVHPTRRRGLTAREAARIQGFPDTYNFQVNQGSPPSKKSLGKWIGDAVPMPLGRAAGLSALSPGWS